jgi:hypothetical protein
MHKLRLMYTGLRQFCKISFEEVCVLHFYIHARTHTHIHRIETILQDQLVRSGVGSWRASRTSAMLLTFLITACDATVSCPWYTHIHTHTHTYRENSLHSKISAHIQTWGNLLFLLPKKLCISDDLTLLSSLSHVHPFQAWLFFLASKQKTNSALTVL